MRGLSLTRLLACAVCTIGCGDNAANIELGEVVDPLDWVDPTIGTGGVGFSYGSSFVGAAVPHGLVKLGPDTRGPFGTIGFQHFSGYYSQDNRIEAFSHLHLHGAGLSDYGVIAMLPVQQFDPGAAVDPAKRKIASYAAKFSKNNERATAGHYDVTFDDGTRAELTASVHVGRHRYTQPAGGWVMLDLDKVLDGGVIDQASLTIDADKRELTGSIHHKGQMSGNFGGYTLYFVIRSEQPWRQILTWSSGAAPSGSPSANGTGLGAALQVEAGVNQFAVAVSMVSLAGARANLAAEAELTFDEMVSAAKQQWREKLSSILLTGSDEKHRRIFYSNFYHAFLMPTIISDVDNTFVLQQGGIQTASGWQQMSDMSLWDTYRTLAPLYALVAPQSARDQARSLLAFADSLGGFPRWPIATGESGTMLGNPADVVIADAALKGVEGVDYRRAYSILREAALNPTAPVRGRGGRAGIEPYLTRGYFTKETGRSVSNTTEHAHNDYALRNLAGFLGERVDGNTFDVRRVGWRKLFDPQTGFLRAMSSEGSFAPTFDPFAMTDEFAEANAWHSLWMTGAHDSEGLIRLLGGHAAFAQKLETFFAEAKRNWEEADESAANFPRPYYWHGNEPALNAAFLFAQAGNPALTQKWSRWIVETLYDDTPNGLAGNDDGGTLGAWYVWSALGFYPIPGSDLYVIGSPRFPRARIAIGQRKVEIVAPETNAEMLYVAGVTIDGVELTTPVLTHQQLTEANSIVFTMAASPQQWGQN